MRNRPPSSSAALHRLLQNKWFRYAHELHSHCCCRPWPLPVASILALLIRIPYLSAAKRNIWWVTYRVSMLIQKIHFPLPQRISLLEKCSIKRNALCVMAHRVEGMARQESSWPPRPANLALTCSLPVATNAFFFWTLSEGGKPFDTAMPAFGWKELGPWRQLSA